MRVLKGFAIVLITLFIIYVVLAFLGPKNYTITRTKEINAPVSIVWNQVADFKKWPSWSSWQEKDTSVINSFSDEVGKIGASMSWVGNEELSGTGSMKITAISQYDSINYDLSFIIPFKMESKGGLKFEEKDGKTLVTWFDKGDFSFFSRPIMLFMDIDKLIGPDFERSLYKVDSISTKQFELLKSSKQFSISETLFSGNNYVAVRHKTTFSEVMTHKFYDDNFKSLGKYVGENQAKLSGVPTSITYSWNEIDSTCEIAVAFPIEGLTNVTQSSYEFIAVKEQKAILGKCYGSMNKIGEAHAKMDAYAKEKGLKIGLVIEEFVNVPGSVPEHEVLTNIFYLIEE